MKRLLLAIALLLLALPSGALAASARGVVLSVDHTGHLIEVVDAQHAVHAYRWRGRLPLLHPGARIGFQLTDGTADAVSVSSGSSDPLSFSARVLSSSPRGLSLRLADGRELNFAARQVRQAASSPAPLGRRTRPIAHIAGTPRDVTLAILGLEPGVTVLVTETVDGAGNRTVTIALPAGVAAAPERAAGVVADVTADTVLLDTPDGTELRLHGAQGTIAGLRLQVCDELTAIYRQHAGILVAESLERTGSSTSGACSDNRPAAGAARPAA